MTTHSEPAAQQPPPRNSLFDPHTAFLDLGIVRTTIAVIVLLALSCVATIIAKDDLLFEFTSQGFNDAAEYFRVPIGLLTLSIPALALLAANHRSEQTKYQMSLTINQIKMTDRQIQIAQGQNVFSNYFKHLEEFEKRYKFKEASKYHVAHPHKLHSRLFPKAAQGELNVVERYVKNLERNAVAFLETCTYFSHVDDWENYSYLISQHMEELGDLFFLGIPSSSGKRIAVQDDGVTKTFMLYGGTVPNTLIHYSNVFSYIDEVLSFDASYKSPAAVAQIMHIRFDLLKESIPEGRMFAPFNISQLLAEAKVLSGYQAEPAVT